MADTTRLRLPYLAAAQSQKHVTHNDALQILDALVHLSVLAIGRPAPPASPAEGDRYLVGASPTGAFAGRAGAVAAFEDGAWRFHAPQRGWIAYGLAEDALFLFDGAAWRRLEFLKPLLANLTGVGIGTSPDATNAFAARLDSALFTARSAAEGGGDVRLVLNRDGATRTASQVFQSAWSGRAELGLSGDDRFRLKVSADGSTWRESLVADPATGAVSFPSGLVGAGPSAFRNLVVNGDFGVDQRGAGPFAFTGTALPTFDGWTLRSATAASATLARTAAPAGGPLSGRFFATFSVTATTAAAAPELSTRLDELARLSGRTVTVSLAYRTTASGFGVSLQQLFGTGGSAAVTGLGAFALPPAAAWTRVSAAVTLPTLAGKTVGAGACVALRIGLAGATPGAIDVADVQVEEGGATPFERRLAAVEMLLARRFFRRSAVALNAADLALEMRAAPTASGTGPFLYSAEL